ncbi:MAG: oligosaccharide flippase family protein, partial [Paramuribaculum sp.]|nr:oligosaccharide flippase family protein [Paramuribaculum sp.]
MAIKQELTKGIFWIGIAKYSGLLLSLGITAILARHISPAAFGTMAVATVIMAFLDIFTDLGIGAAIIQFKDLTKNQLNSLFMVGCGVGSLLAIGLFFLSTTLARYYNDIQLIPVCHCLSITLLFNAFNIVPNGLMLKNKRFKIVSLRTLSFQIISGGVAIWGACNGWGIYALLVSPVITSIGVFAVNIYNYPQRLI